MSKEPQSIERDLRWMREPRPGREAAETYDEIVWIDVAKLDQSWRHDGIYYVRPGGEPGQSISVARYERFGRWIADHDETIWMPHVGFNDEGHVSFTDGRHRFAWLRDHGVRSLPVTVSLETAAEVDRRFGTESRISRLPGLDHAQR